jgi:hypothetical protein
MSNLTHLLAATAVVATLTGAAMAQPSTDAAMGAPPAPANVVEFLSATAMAWEVMVDRQSTCTTPCRVQLDRPHWVTLRTREDRPLRMEVGNLGGGPAQVTAHDIGTGKYATGVTFTTLGGMAAVCGIVFTAVGCGGDRDGMCTAGLITGGAGVVAALGGIWLIRAGLPRVRVRALDRYRLAVYATGTSGGVAGGF